MSDAILAAKQLRKSYFRDNGTRAGNFDALSDVSLSLKRGSICCIQGRSGSGKSTLLACLAGLLVPDEGTIIYKDQDLYALTDAKLSRLRAEYFGVIPQGRSPLFDLNVLDNIVLAGRMASNQASASSDFEERALMLMQRLDIAELSHSYPAQLSGGEQRRMAIARALIGEPDVVFADEPTSDLDDESAKAVFLLLREHADKGAAVLLVTHEANTADIADSLWRMDSGVLSPI